MVNFLCRLCEHFNRFEEKSDLKDHIRRTHLYMLCMSDNFLEHLAMYCTMNSANVSQKNK